MDKLLEKVNIMEISIKRFNHRISCVEQAVDDIKSEVNDMKRLKASIEKVDKLKVQVETFFNNFSKKLDNLYTIVQENHQRNRKENLKNETYSKRFNILIHGLKEQDSNVWESREETEKTVHKFFYNALNIKNSENIKFADIHRMPKQSVLKNGKKIQRSIIIKLTNLFDKQLIYKSLKNLKLYNNELNLTSRLPGYIYVTDHLPIEMLQQKKKLLPLFNKANQEGKRTSWKVVADEYCLYIDGINVNV